MKLVNNLFLSIYLLSAIADNHQKKKKNKELDQRLTLVLRAGSGFGGEMITICHNVRYWTNMVCCWYYWLVLGSLKFALAAVQLAKGHLSLEKYLKIIL